MSEHTELLKYIWIENIKIILKKIYIFKKILQ